MDVKLLFARQFGNPRGLLGRVVGKLMTKGNGSFNRWVGDALSDEFGAEPPNRIVELGHGPGVGTEGLLERFPAAMVWGIDQSATMTAAARTRNRIAVAAGRVEFVTGGLESVSAVAPVDLIVAVHVLYFLHDPVIELGRLRDSLQPDGVLALGFQLRSHMPMPAQIQFPRLGHTLYETSEDVEAVLRQAGFARITVAVDGKPDEPRGFLALARAT